MNTKILYLYRDASNYKVWNSAIVAGLLTEEEKDEIIDNLMDKEFFIPSQVGLPEKQFAERSEDDHPYFELNRCGFEETNSPANTGMAAQELLAKFRKAKGNWPAPKIAM